MENVKNKYNMINELCLCGGFVFFMFELHVRYIHLAHSASHFIPFSLISTAKSLCFLI